jgi:hypothetical protein
VIFGKELEGHNGEAVLLERFPQLDLVHRCRYVGQVEGGRRGVDVGVVFRAGLLETVKAGRRQSKRSFSSSTTKRQNELSTCPQQAGPMLYNMERMIEYQHS